MSEPEQCIICLEPLPLPQSSTVTEDSAQRPVTPPPLPPTSTETPTTPTTTTATTTAATTTATTTPTPTTAPATAATIIDNSGDTTRGTTTKAVPIETGNDNNILNIVAELDGCEHIIHNACIRSWAQKTNTCPICRNVFHTIRVFNGVDGTTISTYKVEDKKQVAEFDFQQWLVENVEEEEEESRPCPLCNSSDREDILLLCDSCDAAYHTHCLGLQNVPEGDWYCMECRHLFQLADDPRTPNDEIRVSRPHHVSRPQPRDSRGYHVRTRANWRRARRQARNFEWQGAWGDFAGRFFDLSDVDLDNADEEVEELEQFRRFQQLDRRELQRWQQRVNIANRLGARDAFANNIPPQISEYLQPPPPPVEETRDERRAWGALERARETEEGSQNTRKRKARSVTASPAEPVQEPERKLKRPRTRRLPPQGESSNSVPAPTPTPTAPTAPAAPTNERVVNGARVVNQASPATRENQTPLVSSLLKELEPAAHSEDEASATASGWQNGPEASSPALSPIHSSHSSPRALSMTPPPLPSANGRPTSPTLSLSTHIEPRYPPANYSPSRNSNDHHESEARAGRGDTRTLELRQPRPRRLHGASRARLEETSPSRTTMTPEEKKNINDIVKNALRPHWRAQKLTSDQYATINRDISRKLYEEVRDASALDEETRRSWESRVTQEVAQAIAGLPA